jgi:hypothetical protein
VGREGIDITGEGVREIHVFHREARELREIGIFPHRVSSPISPISL